jgi:hypothetical protein
MRLRIAINDGKSKEILENTNIESRIEIQGQELFKNNEKVNGELEP